MVETRVCMSLSSNVWNKKINFSDPLTLAQGQVLVEERFFSV
eukprot:COSAG06_NODE_2820_length_6233_cov_12.699463_8_plen_42_part_00